jgi:hypothetical protein
VLKAIISDCILRPVEISDVWSWRPLINIIQDY